MASTHMHSPADGESYAHTHALRTHKHGQDLGFTAHHHEPDETFPPGNLPTTTASRRRRTDAFLV